jgi:hypothetical protein
MSKSSIVRTLLAATFVASLCAVCEECSNDRPHGHAASVINKGGLVESGEWLDKSLLVEIGKDCAVVESIESIDI